MEVKFLSTSESGKKCSFKAVIRAVKIPMYTICFHNILKVSLRWNEKINANQFLGL